MRRTPLRRHTPLRRKATIPRPRVERVAVASPARTQISVRAGVTGVTRARVLLRDGGCVLARFEPDHDCFGALEVHHRKRRSQGGDSHVDNLVTLCAVGHGWVHAHPAVSYAHGLLLHSWEPVEVLE